MLRVALFVSVASVLGLGADCGDEADPATPATQTPPGTTPPATPPPATTKKANRVTGSIKDECGNIITVPGATFKVTANGLQVSGEVHGINPPVAANGTFDAELVSLGNYTVTATITVPWNGKNYVLNLSPVQDNNIRQLSSDGVVQDFVWKLTGTITGQGAPVNPDPQGVNDWYGGAVILGPATYREDKTPSGIEPPPVGTKWEFVLTPTQPKLIDGSDAKVLTIERTYEAYKSPTLTDIPVGAYDLTGAKVGGDGARSPVVFVHCCVEKTFTASVPVKFPLNETYNTPSQERITFDNP